MKRWEFCVCWDKKIYGSKDEVFQNIWHYLQNSFLLWCFTEWILDGQGLTYNEMVGIKLGVSTIQASQIWQVLTEPLLTFLSNVKVSILTFLFYKKNFR